MIYLETDRLILRDYKESDLDEYYRLKTVHLGYFTYPKFWGNGYVTEALHKVLEYAFTQNDVYRVTTGCLAENIGSERVMQKNGLESSR